MPLTDRRRDLWWAAATGLTAFAVYLRTLAPGLVAVLDTPMFQFIGRVLGVAHNPGYPLYVLVTYPFSYLPLGSLAYRINLFSALCGALTVALVFLLARELACRRGVSAAAALGLAFGHIFWSQSIIAEVYTVIDAPVFMLPATTMLWLAAAVGGEQVIRVAGRVRPAGVLATVAMFTLPAWLVATNFEVTDRSGDTTAGVTFDRLFEALPDRTAIVREDFLVDRMVMFKLIGDRTRRP
jgi:hypothetical protein